MSDTNPVTAVETAAASAEAAVTATDTAVVATETAASDVAAAGEAVKLAGSEIVDLPAAVEGDIAVVGQSFVKELTGLDKIAYWENVIRLEINNLEGGASVHLEAAKNYLTHMLAAVTKHVEG